jgi:protein-tyrosine phosphatase
MRLLTVCLGNICRSPTAEAAIRHAADELGVALDVDSAGTGDWHIGELPDARMRAAAKAAGLELTGRARQVEASDLRDFQLVLAMDRDNLRVLDGGAAGFDEVVKICRRTARALVEELVTR